MRNCDVPGHPSALLGPWEPYEMDASISLVDACATGGGVSFRFKGAQTLADRGSAVLGLLRPMTGPQGQIRFVKATMWYAARLGGSGNSLNFYVLEFHSDGTYYPSIANGPPGSENLMFEEQFSPALTNLYKIGLLCGPPMGSNLGDCLANDATPLTIRGMEVVLSEDVPPLPIQIGGSMLADGTQSGVATVTYAAADPQSGVAKVEALVDDVVIATRDLTPRCTYHDFTACPASDEGTLQVDTRGLSNGSHQVAVRVRDAAGNEQALRAPASVEVYNEDAGPPWRISAQLKGSKTVPFSATGLAARTSRGRNGQRAEDGSARGA
jgi:hypothetical protein